MYHHTFWAKGGGPIVFAGISAIEQALCEIKSKALGIPVYERLGGRCRDSARVYANGWSFRCTTPDEFARDAGITNFLIQELYPYRMPEHYQFVDRAPELEVRGGVVPISDRPGLGIELVLARARPFLWAECQR